MENKSCFDLKIFILKKCQKDTIIMISIIIHNNSNKYIIYKEKIWKKSNEKWNINFKISTFIKIIENKS
jgi:hypothetical protein